MGTNRELAILVTGAGAPGIRGTIYALRNNPDKLRVRIIGVDASTDVVGRFLVESFYQVPAPESARYIEELCAVCQREVVDVVVPQTTREIEVLSAQWDELRKQKIPVMVSPHSTISIANNKWALLKCFQELDLPCPRFELVRCERELITAVHHLGYPAIPVVVKPPVSNGMRGVRILRTNAWDVSRFLSEKPSGLEITLEDLVAMLRRGPGWPELLAMEYLPGSEYTVDAFLGKTCAIALPRLRKSIRSGITFRSESILDESMSQQTLKVAKHIGLRYAFGFQFKLNSQDQPTILECNPRVQGTMVNSVFGGANVIWMGVKELLGEPIEQLEQPSRRASFYRFWGGIGVVDGHTYEI